MNKLNPAELALMDRICDLLADSDVSPEKGETILCIIVGTSCGQRGGSLLSLMKPLAHAYRLAAND